MDFAERLSFLMEESSLSNLKLAKTIGVSDRLIGAWRKGENGPTLISASRIADFFDVSLDYLSGRSDNRHESTKKELTTEISGDEQELLELFGKLTYREQQRLIGRLQGLDAPLSEREQKEKAPEAKSFDVKAV